MCIFALRAESWKVQNKQGIRISCRIETNRLFFTVVFYLNKIHKIFLQLRWGLGLDGLINSLGNISRAGSTVDINADISVASLHGINIGMELLETDLDLLFGIVTALLKASQYFLIIRRREGHVVNLSSDRIGTTTNNTLNKDIVGNIEEKEAIS